MRSECSEMGWFRRPTAGKVASGVKLAMSSLRVEEVLLELSLSITLVINILRLETMTISLMSMMSQVCQRLFLLTMEQTLWKQLRNTVEEKDLLNDILNRSESF